MEKKTLMQFLASLSTYDTQVCVFNWEDGIANSLYNISITDDKDRTIKLTCGGSGVIIIEGKCNYQTLKTIRLIDDFLTAQSHVDYCNDFMENGTL